MNYSAIYQTSLADGNGWRTVLFVSGCNHKCKDCHNKEAWDPKHGKKFTSKTKEFLFSCIKDNIDGLTLSGGDPLYSENIDEVTQLCKEFKERFPNKTIWLYTGSTYEDCTSLEIMNYIDVMVDGFGADAVKHFCILNAFKYVWRAEKKNGIEDIKKAVWYLNKYIELGGKRNA